MGQLKEQMADGGTIAALLHLHRFSAVGTPRRTRLDEGVTTPFLQNYLKDIIGDEIYLKISLMVFSKVPSNGLL